MTARSPSFVWYVVRGVKSIFSRDFHSRHARRAKREGPLVVQVNGLRTIRVEFPGTKVLGNNTVLLELKVDLANLKGVILFG